MIKVQIETFMQTLFIGILLALGVSATAQTARESMGAAAGGFSAPASITPQEQQVLRAQLDAKIKIVRATDISKLTGGQIYRTVNGKTYNIIRDDSWQSVSGKLYQKSEGIVILNHELKSYSEPGKYEAITNYLGSEVDNQWITTAAMKTGTFDNGGRPIVLWDCGTVATGAQLEQIKTVEAKQQAVVDEQVAKVKKAEAAKIYASQVRAVALLEAQATNGSASAQYSLAEHYLAGQGCATNRENAIYWLTQAANQGDMAASNKLSKLKLP